MELKSDFDTFLTNIRPSSNQRSDLILGHKTLRDRIAGDKDLSPFIISDFLQGSYRRATAVRPTGDSRPDVDIIVVTNINEADYTPQKAMQLFVPFLNSHYKGKWRPQGRSFGIELSYVDLDLVITSAPSETEQEALRSESVRSDDDLDSARDWRFNANWIPLDERWRTDAAIRVLRASQEAEWKTAPLRIPDRVAGQWEDTHPLEQIRWTRDMNAACSGHFVNVVKALKWWRLENYDEPKHPKGFPLERIIGDCCPSGVSSVAEGITRTLEVITTKYAADILAQRTPILPDYGVPGHNVLKRITFADFCAFYSQACEGALLARQALDSADRTESGTLWRKLLGSKFPEPPDNGGQKRRSGFTQPEGPAVPGGGRFA